MYRSPIKHLNCSTNDCCRYSNRPVGVKTVGRMFGLRICSYPSDGRYSSRASPFGCQCNGCIPFTIGATWYRWTVVRRMNRIVAVVVSLYRTWRFIGCAWEDNAIETHFVTGAALLIFLSTSTLKYLFLQNCIVTCFRWNIRRLKRL
jgi:hypothetical protein